MTHQSPRSMQEFAALLGADRLKKLADHLERSLRRAGTPTKRATLLEGLAAGFGYRSWNGLTGALKHGARPALPSGTPFPPTGLVDTLRYLAGRRQPSERLLLVGPAAVPVLVDCASRAVAGLLALPVGKPIDAVNDLVDELLHVADCGGALEGLDYRPLGPGGLMLATGRLADSEQFAAYLASSAQVPGPHVLFEYDRQFTGGDYDQTGDFVAVPLGLCQALGDAAAFTAFTGLDACHIIYYSGDELVDAAGEDYPDELPKPSTGVNCCFCLQPVPVAAAHRLADGRLVGDCCWDERLRD